jgi:predicted metal-dependent HD superfamily phosphohydrolase
VFARPELRGALERKSIPALQARLNTALVATPDAVVEFPLYFEASWPLPLVDMVVAVHCDERTQVQRVAARDGASPAKIAAIQAAQLSTAAKVSLADWSIDTSGDLASVEAQVSKLAQAARANLPSRAQRDLGTDKAWPFLKAAYTEPHRRYHTLEHLRAMFERLDAVRPLVAHPTAVALAIWFHDVVYETDERYLDNEVRSVKAMGEVLRDTASPLLTAHENGLSVLALAAELILATKGHRPGSGFLQSRPAALADAQLFLDIDLAILAREPAVVDRFDGDIRSEFARYDDSAFGSGRVQALQAFLDRDQVFFSESFAPLETTARRNLHNLITRWRQPAASL